MATKSEMFRVNVIRPVLKEMDLYSLAAEELLLGTAVQESLNFTYRTQMGGGPAKSYFQMEPATHDDIWNNFLCYKAELADKVIATLTAPNADKIDELENNDFYAAAMARVHYYRVPKALPDAGDLTGQAKYWKQYYNTPLGKGKVSEYVEKWELYVMEGYPEKAPGT
ncbi:hypothetical protein A9Q81_23380 [Gammaproteobacteria bacterium 42_54_T18]|nr:hypothetical protein A9Q81_23380 [Gammaproteobacteria bacterium 42_54_T18]